MSQAVRNRELDEPNALVERIAQAVHAHILATEPQTTGAGIVAVIRGFLRQADIDSVLARHFETAPEASAEEWRGAYFALAAVAQKQLDECRAALAATPSRPSR